MKVYIRKEKNNEFKNINFFTAYDGFKQLGAEIIFFNDAKDIKDNNIENIIISGIGDVRYILNKFNISYPTLEYPDELCTNDFLGRRLWKDKLGNVIFNKEKMNIFIKPVSGGKLFTGTVVRDIKDFRECAGLPMDTEIWCSEILDIISEYRCFIRYGEIIDIKNYKGNPFICPSKELLENMIKEYTNAPKSYTIDIGVTKTGITVLIEVNEGYSVGCYGLNSMQYAKFLITRWAELTKTDDEYNF